eukprot:3938433-Karenia_brevis.AAC.1
MKTQLAYIIASIESNAAAFDTNKTVSIPHAVRGSLTLQLAGSQWLETYVKVGPDLCRSHVGKA